MELPTQSSEGEAKEAASGNGNGNFFSKRFAKFLGVFLLIIGIVGGGYQIWHHYFSADAKMQANYERYQDWQAQYDKAMKEDTYGGKTPQETLSMFIDALKKGDVDLASKYFALETNEKDPNYLTRKKWEQALQQAKEKGQLSEMTRILLQAKSAGSSMPGYYGFEIRDEEGNLIADISMIENKYSGAWKIESL